LAKTLAKASFQSDGDSDGFNIDFRDFVHQGVLPPIVVLFTPTLLFPSGDVLGQHLDGRIGPRISHASTFDMTGSNPMFSDPHIQDTAALGRLTESKARRVSECYRHFSIEA
jgi:hypothetical protein